MVIKGAVRASGGPGTKSGLQAIRTLAPSVKSLRLQAPWSVPLVPVKASDPVKTDRKRRHRTGDGTGLAKLHRAGEVAPGWRSCTGLAKLHGAGGLTVVRVPDAAEEAMLELARARTGPGAICSGCLPYDPAREHPVR